MEKEKGVDFEEEMVESREWVLSKYAANGFPTSDHLQMRTTRVIITEDSVPEGHAMVQLLYISVDPYMRTRMNGLQGGLYFPQYELNQAITAMAVGRLIKSKDPNYQAADIVVSPFFPLAEYCVTPTTYFRKIDPDAGISLPDYISAFGLPGFSAWIGIEVLGNPKPGENVFISAAAGGVGMYAGQLAKLKGCRVVGSTGSDDKVKLLKEEFGYDDAFNYKKEKDFDDALSKYFPNGIDVYLDNVGGEMLEAVLNHVNNKARIPVCGAISQYNQVWNESKGVRNLLNIVGKEVRMEGFLLASYLNRFGEFVMAMESHLKQGKIVSKHKIYYGIETFLESLESIFSGSNAGKVLIQVCKQ
ncbi:PREDICTED: 2-alkenal reductase (NADP(+)-dependent)-like [Nelumbo nucifera]|uniref:2-alkenal reductase (NADP(+)-dependent)-like n=1 Tax=Nelumbo nucifera TaxID=4432 RepID=A0A1U8BF71_NELNU|nr:PREDICTED: 2-alkenal reductase (NADP(+)-dependent)-like [Nelumbo nucifera]